MVGFLSSLTEAVLTSTASLFLQSRLSPGEPILNIGIGIGTIAGALLAVHWTSGIVFGPAIGALSDRLGQGRTVVLLVIILLGGISGAIFLLSGKLSLVLFSVVLIAGSGLFVTLSAAASGLATRSERPHIYMGAFATAIDAGSAMGPLIAYSLRSFVGLSPVYLSTGSLLLLAALRYWRAERKSGSPKRLKQS
jgi:MFS family permease